MNELVDLFFDEETIIEPPIIIEPKTPPNTPIMEKVMNLGFITYWNHTDNDLSKYTHLSYAFLDIDDNGMPNYKNVNNIKLPWNYSGKKGLSIGGSVGSGKVMRILKDNEKRRRFIRNVIDNMKNDGFSYLNYDLE